MKQIARSIERFGFTNPVLVSDDGEIIAGHGRVRHRSALRQHDLRFTQLADDLFRLVFPRHSISPSWSNLKQILGHSEGGRSLEYRDALHMIADGKVRCEVMVTGVVGLDGVEGALAELGNPETHAKILVDPARSGAGN